MGHYYYTMAFIAIFIFIFPITSDYALIRYPVVDLYGSATVPETPVPASTRNNIFCPRIHQALAQEVFEIEQKGFESCCIIIPWAIYGYDESGKPQNRYWIANKNFILISQLHDKDLLKALPAFNHKENIITLKRPFTTPNGTTFSVGTQFVRTHEQNNKNIVRVKYVDIQTKTIQHYDIPVTRIIEYQPYSPQRARHNFVLLITEFIAQIGQQPTLNTIPYVWGGSSFIQAYSSKFIEDVSGFHRVEPETVPICGYDCSNLILRFAHMAQLPYFFKTTSMLEKYGKKFTNTDTLEEGDLMWLPGHVVIITDLKNHLVTEACGYENGVGKVRTIKLSQLLKNIHTWQDLLHAHNKKQTVTRLQADGGIFKSAQQLKIFKLIQEQ